MYNARYARFPWKLRVNSKTTHSCITTPAKEALGEGMFGYRNLLVFNSIIQNNHADWNMSPYDFKTLQCKPCSNYQNADSALNAWLLRLAKRSVAFTFQSMFSRQFVKEWPQEKKFRRVKNLLWALEHFGRLDYTCIQ